jgi:hypothetical protein
MSSSSENIFNRIWSLKIKTVPRSHANWLRLRPHSYGVSCMFNAKFYNFYIMMRLFNTGLYELDGLSSIASTLTSRQLSEVFSSSSPLNGSGLEAARMIMGQSGFRCTVTWILFPPRFLCCLRQ